jgi:hypothetical protein
MTKEWCWLRMDTRSLLGGAGNILGLGLGTDYTSISMYKHSPRFVHFTILCYNPKDQICTYTHTYICIYKVQKAFNYIF